MGTNTTRHSPYSKLNLIRRETAATDAARARAELMRLAAAAAAGERAAAVLRLREDGLRLGALGVHRGGPLGGPCALAGQWKLLPKLWGTTAQKPRVLLARVLSMGTGRPSSCPSMLFKRCEKGRAIWRLPAMCNCHGQT